MPCLVILQSARCSALEKKAVSIEWAANPAKLRDVCKKATCMARKLEEWVRVVCTVAITVVIMVSMAEVVTLREVTFKEVIILNLTMEVIIISTEEAITTLMDLLACMVGPLGMVGHLGMVDHPPLMVIHQDMEPMVGHLLKEAAVEVLRCRPCTLK